MKTLALVLVALVCSLVSPVSVALAQGTTVLNVDGEQVSIHRDQYGVPHIFADTRRALFKAYGYVVAQDRLWQLEVNRRTARGRLAEIFGSSMLPADRQARILGYTDAELAQQFAALPIAQQEVFTSYVAGINRYIAEVVTPNPGTKLPFEFHFLGMGVPAPWTTFDAWAFAVDRARPFLEGGEGEREAQTLFNALTAVHGPEGGLGIFNDLQWINDPDAPTSVPTEGAFGKKQKPPPYPPASQLTGASSNPDTEAESAREVLRALGVPIGLGSHGWVVSAAKSTERSAMLFGGPQVGFGAPALMHEVQLKANDLNVTGMAFAGIPLILVGRNNHIAWTSMDAFLNNVDIYVETVCGGGFMFNGVCTPYQSRVETIAVRGAPPVQLTVERSVHGPVVATGAGVKFARKSIQRMREFESIGAFMAFSDADGIDAFKAAIHRMVGGAHFIYGDKAGNIAYWRAGKLPVRPEREPGIPFDIRLPLPGDGSAEWTGELLPIPSSINPTRGWLANWNNKADVSEVRVDPPANKLDRVRDIEARLQGGPISLADMRDIAKYIARTGQGGVGRSRAQYLMPYMLAALDVVPPEHSLAAQARAVLQAWDGSTFADVASPNLEPGEVIFNAWVSELRRMTFADEVPAAFFARANAQVLIHVLDESLGGGSGVPPSRDYFNGADPNERISVAFDQALTALGTEAAWSSQGRDVTQFRHRFFPTIPEVGSMLASNKATFAQIVVFHTPKLYSESIITLGQSGFIQRDVNGAPVLDPHFRDQLDLYKSFGYKPMRLYQNKQLQE